MFEIADFERKRGWLQAHQWRGWSSTEKTDDALYQEGAHTSRHRCRATGGLEGGSKPIACSSVVTIASPVLSLLEQGESTLCQEFS